MNQEQMLKLADEVAQKAHEGQCDKGGAPYILHPRAVASRLEGAEEKIVGLLHDVVEDNEAFTLDELRRRGFSERIVQAVDAITKREGEEYDRYLLRVSQNKIATAVKLADLAENLDVSRLPEPETEAQREKIAKRIKKYRRAKDILENKGTKWEYGISILGSRGWFEV